MTAIDFISLNNSCYDCELKADIGFSYVNQLHTASSKILRLHEKLFI